MVTKRHPTPEERDERIKLDVEPEEFIEGVLAAGPHPDEEDEKERRLPTEDGTPEHPHE